MTDEACATILDLRCYDAWPEEHWSQSESADNAVVLSSCFRLQAKAVGVWATKEGQVEPAYENWIAFSLEWAWAGARSKSAKG